MLAQMNAIDTLMPEASTLILDPAADIRANLAWALGQLLVMMYMPTSLTKNDEYELLQVRRRSKFDFLFPYAPPPQPRTQEKIDTNIFPLLLILLTDDKDPVVALTVLKSLVATEAPEASKAATD